MKLAWLTDIHLNFLHTPERLLFYQKLIDCQSDAILLTGDIAEAPSLSPLLEEMAEAIRAPIYFILGNHDYYHSSIKKVREEMLLLSEKHTYLTWLPQQKFIKLTDDSVLLGHDGWADARYGDFFQSRLRMNDWNLIEELRQVDLLGPNALLQKLQFLADSDANALQQMLENVWQQNFKQVIVLTHVPPFAESCLHNGQPSAPDWLPFFASKATGEVLRSQALQHPDKSIIVLCGHTHCLSQYQAEKNLLVRTGQAKYGAPEIQDIIMI